MSPDDDSVINELTNTVSVAVLIYLIGIVIFAGSSTLGLRFSVNPLFGILIPMGIVFVAFTLYYYREYE